ncbi:MAG: substrate-binding domain-containing protein [Oscillospiraceae bacterium]
MKKRLASMASLALSVIMLTGLAGCGGEIASDGTAAQESTGQKYKIGIAMSTYDDQWLSYLIDEMNVYADENKGEFEFKFTDAQNDINTQLGQVEQMIADGCNAIVCNPVETDSSAPIVDACNEAGVPIVSVNRPFANQDDATAYCGGDSKRSGEIVMENVAKLANYKGKVAVLAGEATHEAARLRTEGIQEVCNRYDGLEIVYLQNAKNWERAKAMALTEDLIQSGIEFDIVIGECDEIAIGAILALEDAGKTVGKDGILVGGIDGTPDGLSFMDEGKLLIDVFQNASGQARGAMDAAMAACKGESVEKQNLIDYELITPDLSAKYQELWANIT